MKPIYNLLRIKADGTKVPLTDGDGLNIVAFEPTDYYAAIALDMAKATSGPMENAVWEEIK